MTRPWADTPFALLATPGSSMPGALTTTNPGVLSVAIEMANVHNTLLRGLNAIYLQAPHVHLAQDIADFMLFAATWQDTIHHHHELEETFFFPQANELARATLGESVMDANIDQHRAFEDGLTDMAEFIGAVRDGRRKYDGAALQKCIDRFAPVLTAHLHDEIKTIMRLEKCDGEKIKAQFAKCAQEGAKNVDPNIILPFFFGCIDRSYPGSENFPPLPFFVPWLIAYWYSRTHRGSWRFSPSDHWGRARPLQFLG